MPDEVPDQCPACDAELDSGPVPARYRKLVGTRRYNRAKLIEVRLPGGSVARLVGCPDCGAEWPACLDDEDDDFKIAAEYLTGRK